MTGAELKAYRIQRGLSQSELAKKLGIRRWKAISDYENGMKPIPAWVVEKIIKSENEKSKK